MRPSLRSTVVGLVGGSLVASGTVSAGEAPDVEPAFGPPASGDRPERLPAQDAGTYESCSAEFGLTKDNVAPFGISVVAGSGEVPDPLPVVPDDLLPVVTIEVEGEGTVECTPEQGWTDEAGFYELFEVGFFAASGSEGTFAPFPGTNYYLIPSPDAFPEINSITIRHEHMLDDSLSVSTAPTDLMSFQNPTVLTEDQVFGGTGLPLIAQALRDEGFTDEADFIESLDEPEVSCEDDPAAAADALAAFVTVFGLGTDDNTDFCEDEFFLGVGALYSINLRAVIEDNQVVVTIDGPAPTTTTTTTTTTTLAPTTLAPTTTIDDDAGVVAPTTVAPILPPTGDTTSRSALLASLLVALGLGGVMISRRPRTDA
jgi:hypothetical protein